MKRVLTVLFFVCIASSVFAGQTAGDHEGVSGKDSAVGGKEIEGKLREVWAGMGAKLASGDIEGALGFFVGPRREKYRKTFTEMTREVQASFLSNAEIALGELRNGMAECFASGNMEGVKFSYPVSFSRTAEGEWKISDF